MSPLGIIAFLRHPYRLPILVAGVLLRWAWHEMQRRALARAKDGLRSQVL